MDPDSPYVDQIKQFEGFKPKATWDYKQWTNGYGTKAQYPGEVIDRATAEQRLHNELGNASAYVDSVNPNLDPGARAALTSLTFNAGTGWGNQPLGAAVRSGDMQAALPHFLSYNKAGGETNSGLVQRRAAEAGWIGNTPMSNAFDNPSVVAPAQRAPAMGYYPPQLNGGGVGNVGDNLQRVGAWLLARDHPEALSALTALGPRPGRYTQSVDPDSGDLIVTDTQTGQVTRTPFRKPAAQLAADKKTAESGVEDAEKVAGGGTAARLGLATLDKASSLVNNPDIYQGTGGEAYNDFRKGMNSFGIKKYDAVGDADLLNSLSKESLGNVKDAIGNISRVTNFDLSKIFQPANFGLDQSRQGNLNIINQHRRILQLNAGLSDMAEQFRDPNTGTINVPAFKQAAHDYVVKAAQGWQQQDQAQFGGQGSPQGTQRPPLSSFMR